MKREHKIEGEQEEINYLSHHGLYGELLLLPVVKMDVLGCTFVKELLFSSRNTLLRNLTVLQTTLGEASASHNMDHNLLTSNLLSNTTNIQMHVAFLA